MAKTTKRPLATLRNLDPHHFEQFIADVWQERQGWQTKVKDKGPDRGVDIIGIPPGKPNQRAIVQAKRYAADNKITSEQIQQYAALRQQYDSVDSVAVVTTSSFTEPAEDLAERLNVKCIDGEMLIRIINEYDATEILEWYAAGKPEVQ